MTPKVITPEAESLSVLNQYLVSITDLRSFLVMCAQNEKEEIPLGTLITVCKEYSRKEDSGDIVG